KPARQLEHFDNLIGMFFARAAEKGDAPFLWAKRGGEWKSTSWAAARRQVIALATAFKAMGLEPGDRVMLVSENRPEWLISDLAIMAAGCVTVPTYTTNTTRDHAHVLGNSGARAVIVSSQKLAKNLIPAVLTSTDCHHVIGIEEIRAGQVPEWINVHCWPRLVAKDGDAGEVEKRAKETKREDLACIIYTSGTGGAPRGVMLHHGAILHNIAGATDVISSDFGWDDEIFLSFLPASHALEHTGGQLFPIGLGAQIYYAESLDKLAANIEEVRPTIMIVVPRLFEMLRARILKGLEGSSGLSKYLFKRALEIGVDKSDGRLKAWNFPMDRLLEVTLRRKLRKKVGGRVKAWVSGGAPLNPDVGIFFQSLGITFLQGYGQTEAAPVISCNRPSVGIRLETVGPPIRDTEVRIAEDGEIMVRGELVMHGYWRNPEETARVLKDGWLATGDIGHFDEKGRIVITDRKKDIIVNDKGDNVAPQRIEGMLTLQPEIAQAMAYGDRRPHLVALLVPDAEIAGQPDLHQRLSAAVDRVNSELSIIEKVRRFIVADEPFTVENEQLTPSMKIRRHVIKGVYGDRLEGLYGR
ncbi:MAG TPA: AMP-dependent synthetase/ligase, partial [Sphingomicrobium sp.]|nr:AMP-dependent synthetase/ligase [Sphingomicrobium sp.]